MAKKKTYYDYLRDELGSLVEQLELPDLYKQSLKQRWIDQVLWADKKADQCRRWHQRLRLTTIISGVVLPALVGINFQLGKDNAFFRAWFPYVPFVLSQVIAVSAALEEFHRYGDRWRDYRKMAEDLKAEGWQYLQLSGSYEHLLDHMEGYSTFASRVESVIKNDVQNYIAALQQQQAKENEQIKQILKSANDVATDKTLFAQPLPSQQPQQLFGSPSAGMAAGAPLLPAAGSVGILRVRQDTDFQLTPQPASLLPDTYKIRIGSGNTFGLQSYVQADNNYLQVALDRGLGNENRNVWFVYTPHVEILSGSASSMANPMGSPNTPNPMMGAPSQAPNPMMGASPQAPNLMMGAPSQAPNPMMGASPQAPNPMMGASPQAPNPMMGASPQAPNPMMGAPSPSTSASPGEIKLAVPYFSQLDNQQEALRTCNTSSCAMVAKFLGANISGDDEYFQYVTRYGDTTDHGVQTQALAELGIQSTWNTNLDFEDLDQSLTSGLPIVIGILHHGPVDAPTGGGHMIVVIGRTANGDYFVNDPYGNLLDDYISDNGGGLTYPRYDLSRRWTADGTKTGWGRLFYGNNVGAAPAPAASTQTATTQAAPPQTAQTLFASGAASSAGASGQYMTAEQLIQIAGSNAPIDRLRQLAPSLNEVLAHFQINTARRICHFIAQVAHESDCFNAMEEYASGEDYEGRDDLGNTQTGDGVRFKGRGLIQLTGRSNYEEFSKAMNQDFTAQPELVGQIPWAIWVAGWYWDTRQLNEYADRDDLEGVTLRVNGGYNGLEDRRGYLQRAKSVLGA
jgi:predicted chitinase